MEYKPKPVTILTGFLGSGKTTLLNAIIQHRKQTRFAIIENEVGKIGIDGQLVVKNTGPLTELNSGCICCSINDTFYDTLKILSKQDDWDELIIEATGIANPEGILSPFLQFPWVQTYFGTPEVICIVDAKNIKEQLELSSTVATQLAYGDKIYINKVDLITQQQLEFIIGLVQQFNPFASTYSGSRYKIPISGLRQIKKSKDGSLDLMTRSDGINHQPSHDHFKAVSLEYTQSFNENKLFARLYYHLLQESVSLYRFKGVFFDSRKSKKIIIQSAMQSLLAEDGEPWIEEEPKVSKFVFIGKNLKSEQLDELLKGCIQ